MSTTAVNRKAWEASSQENQEGVVNVLIESWAMAASNSIATQDEVPEMFVPSSQYQILRYPPIHVHSVKFTNEGEQNGFRQPLVWHLSFHQRLALAVA